jgi:hypothetical protein
MFGSKRTFHVLMGLTLGLISAAGCGADKSPIYLAAEHNDDATIRKLTASGTPADSALANNRTALHAAAAGGNLQATQALLDAGANPGFKDDRGDTPLMMASARGFTTIVQAMLQKNPAIDEQNNSGKTALEFAVEHNFPEVAKLLVAKGAKIDIVDEQGRSAKSLAEANGMLPILQGKNPQP